MLHKELHLTNSFFDALQSFSLLVQLVSSCSHRQKLGYIKFSGKRTGLLGGSSCLIRDRVGMESYLCFVNSLLVRALVLLISDMIEQITVGDRVKTA